MQERHRNRKVYFDEQGLSTERYVVPFIQSACTLSPSTTVLEVGCGEGGNLVPFIHRDCQVTAIELAKESYDNATTFLASYPNVTLIHDNIYNISPDQIGHFDLIILRDVIEHIPDQAKLMVHLRQFLRTDSGILFIAFPPWQNPFGGHQQVLPTKWLSLCPYIHLLPTPLYRKVLTMAGEDPTGMLEIKETGISLEQFYRYTLAAGYTVVRQTLYIINPNYEVKFSMKPLELPSLMNIPYLRNFYTTCGYFLLK